MYHGDIRLEDTIDIKFTTRQISGAPSTLGSSPVISAYPGNSTTQLTAGITLSVDFDSVTGLNNVRVAATNANGYATATNYVLVITTGTVNSVSVVGECIGSFSIENRSAVMPTTAARTLDVSATGEAGVDWGNVGSKTTSNALTGTTIAVTQKVDVETIKTNPVVNGGTVTFASNTTVANTAGAVGSVTGAVGSVTGLTASDVGAIKAKTDNLPSDPADASDIAASFATIAAYIDTEIATIVTQTGAAAIRAALGLASANLDTQLSTIDDFLDTEVAAIKAKTDLIPGTQDGYTFAQLQLLMACVLLSKASGMGTATGVFRSLDDAKDRITATQDADGNRTAVVRDAS
jgi:hypothetical protein